LLRVAAGLAGSLILLAATGCAGEEKAAPPATPTPMADLDTTALQVPRIEFCELVPASAISDALGAEPDSETSYRSGDEADLPGVGTEVVHEIGCSWGTDAAAAARAWVFARPVDAAFAKTVLASSRETKGCRTEPGPSYGEPSLTQTCRLPDGTRRVRHAGLFGQTWLSCEVSAPAPAEVPALSGRSERWCVEVANTLNTSR
jgi:hypothetical protein